MGEGGHALWPGVVLLDQSKVDNEEVNKRNGT